MCIVQSHRHAVPIDVLPDNVFLEIFDFCINDPFEFPSSRARNWQTLVHVCQRWRGIIFASPCRLDLHLKCSSGTPLRKNLVFWPANLPLIVDHYDFGDPISPESQDSIVAALEHPGRVRRINIHAQASLIKKVVVALRKSFPVLTHLDLTCPSHNSVHPVLSSRILGGSSIPHIQHLHLRGISFPQSPSPFSSARNLVSLHLEMVAQGYISPDVMVRSLAMLTRLEDLSISFRGRIPPSDQWGSHTYPQIRTILPTLTYLKYEGRSEYLEDISSRIDTPRVNFVRIEYSMHRIQAFELCRFIERTENLKIDQFTRAQLFFYDDDSFFGLCRSQEAWSESHLHLKIIGVASLEVQVRDMAHLIGQLSATFSRVDDLFVHGDNGPQSGGMAITEWLPLLHLFPAVETLRLSECLAVHVTSALEGTTEEMATDVFPALSLIRIAECEDESPEDKGEHEDDWMEQVGSMERFLSLRQLSGNPVRVINLEDELAEVEKRW
jgi:hypothetical protein